MPEARNRKGGWLSLFAVAICALVTIVVGDVLLSRVAPVPPRIMEVDDGIEMLRSSDPDTLVLGSSHTRSFIPMREPVLEQTLGENEMVFVPVEWGIFSSYRWVLENRVAPLIDERHDGKLVRPSLKRVLLITTFYDMCNVQHIGNVNLPARAWQLEHFVEDVNRRGLNTFNRNFLTTRWKALFPGSVLVQDRGYERTGEALRQLVRPVDENRKAELRAERIVWLTGNMERQHDICWYAPERAALDEILNFFVSRGIEPTIVLFPLVPDIISQKSRETTLPRYGDYAAQLGRDRNIRVVDMTFGSPFQEPDFQDDFDHLTRVANHRFSRWALENHFQFLLEPPQAGGAP